MNRLRELRQGANLTLRELSEYTGVAHTGLHNLEMEQRPFRERHIARLTAFLDVTSDYLLGYSEEGLGVYFNSAEYDEDHIFITKKAYKTLLEQFSVSQSIIARKNETRLVIELPKGKKPNNYSSTHTIYRRIKIEKEKTGFKKFVRATIEKELDKMDTLTLEKILKFIKDYLR